MKPSAPNILLLLTDQQHWLALGAAGNPHLRTPNMDRLVREGTMFRRAYCAAPVCGPSRMSLATGLPPHEHRFTHHFSEPWDWKQRGLTSFGHHLQAAGYDTYWIGKWHASDVFAKRPDSTPGFIPLSPESWPQSGRENLGWEMDARWTDRAVEFLRAPPGEPFFLGLSIHNPHDVCYMIMKMYEDEVVRPNGPPGDAPLPPLPDNFAIDPCEPELIRFRRTVKEYGPEVQWTKTWTQEDWRRYLYGYYRLVEKADRELGRALDALDASGLADHTLVVFTSDHGEGCAAHQLVVKLSPYEEALRVPLIVRGPGVPAGKIVETALASGLDLAPTLLDYAGAAPLPRARGISLRDALSGGKEPLRDFIVSELYPDQLHPERESRIACTSSAKYMFAVGGAAAEEALWDLRNDPGETRNLAGRPEAWHLLGMMRTRLGGWMRETSDPLLDRFVAWEKAAPRLR